MKKLFKRISIFALCVAMTLSFVGCGAFTVEDDKKIDENATVIDVFHFGGGVGRIWLDEAIVKFKELKANEVYETGKKGIDFRITDSVVSERDSMSSSGHNIYFDQSISTIKTFTTKGALLDISDIMDDVIDTRNGQDVTLLDKIADDMEHSLKGVDGNFYALPHYEWFPGLTYDAESFKTNNLFLADSSVPDSQTVIHDCTIIGKQFRFVKNDSVKKSVGNDGVYNTIDDGIPSTLEEFIALCDFMKTKKGIVPFTVAGGHIDYYSNLVGAMWSYLAGGDEMTTSYTFKGKVKVVTGFEETALFNGADVATIKKPIIEEKSIDKVEDGYWTTQSVARYYAAAFTELAKIKNWFSKDSTNQNSSHTTTQARFVMSGLQGNEKVGMLIEGSYWYNESVKNSVFKDYTYVANKENRDIAWMSLPTSYDVPATENNGRQSVFIDYGSAYAFINANIKENEGLVRACKDFLKFLYTDAQLVDFTKYSGSVKAKINYDLSDLEGLSLFQKSIIDLRASAKVVYQTADNDKASTRMIDCNSTLMKPFGYADYFSAVRNSKTAVEIFNITKTSSNNWGN